MSTTFNQSSSYNRTVERKVFEESGGAGGGGIPRLMTSSPLYTIKSTMGGLGGAATDLGLGSVSFVQPHNYHFGTATSGSFHLSDEQLSVSMDVSAFAPEELKVSIVGTQVVVEGKHPEKQDALGSIERHFIRKFQLPRNAHPDTVQSNLTSDGTLTITATAPKIKESSPARTIPIKIVGNGGMAAAAAAPSSTSQQASSFGGVQQQQQQQSPVPQNGTAVTMTTTTSSSGGINR